GRGRGSSVSSIVCYLLGLSHIDPVANRLFIGRFLNETLASVPDIDLDFPREIRKELDLPLGEIEQTAKLADRRSGGGGLADELDQLPGFEGRRTAPLWK